MLRNHDSDCSERQTCTGGTCEKSCDACNTGEVCINNECRPGCSSDTECPADQTCVDGACQPDEGGGPCEDDTDCPEGQICSADGTCLPPDCTTTDCPSGYECVDGTCQPDEGCSVDGQCPEGYHCENGECIPDPECNQDSDCPEGYICENGECIEDYPGCYPECDEDEVCVEGECESECDEDEVIAATQGVYGANQKCLKCETDPNSHWTISLSSDEMNRDWLLIYPNLQSGVATRKSFYASTTAPSGGTWEWTVTNSSEDEGGKVEIVAGANTSHVKIRSLHESKKWGDISLMVKYKVNGECISATAPVTVRKITSSGFVGSNMLYNKYDVDYVKEYIHYFNDQWGRTIYQVGIPCTEYNERISGTTLINPIRTGSGKTRIYTHKDFNWIPSGKYYFGILDAVGFDNPHISGDAIWRQTITAGGWVVPYFNIEYSLDVQTNGDTANITKTLGPEEE